MGIDFRFVNDIRGRDQGIDVIVGTLSNAGLVHGPATGHFDEFGIDFDE